MFSHQSCLSRMGTKPLLQQREALRTQDRTCQLCFGGLPEATAPVGFWPILCGWSITDLSRLMSEESANDLEPSSNCLVYIYWQSPFSSSSSCHPALCLLCGEDGGVPHLLTTRPDNEILPGTRQSAWLHFNAFTFFLWKRTAYTSTNNSLVECEWGWMLYGRMLITAQSWILISWGLFP